MRDFLTGFKEYWKNLLPKPKPIDWKFVGEMTAHAIFMFVLGYSAAILVEFLLVK